jgi:glycerophosphoryl diester phosphodiesterase
MSTARRVLHIAHRGGSLEAPENTLHAFRHAVSLGADMLEMDLRATADGEVVVIHDPDVDRVTDGTGPVATHTLDELRQLDAAHWFVPGAGPVRGADEYPLRGVARSRKGTAPGWEDIVPDDLRVPTLSEVLQAFPAVPITIDLKVGEPELGWFHEAVAGLLAEHGRTEDVIVGSFATERLVPLRRYAPHLPTSAAQTEVAAFWAGEALPAIGRLVALQVPATYGDIEVVTSDFVARAHDEGLDVHVWVVDDESEMRRLVDLGVDGLVTDRPTTAARVLGELAPPSP